MYEEGPARKEKAVLRVDPEFTALIPHLPPLNRKFIFKYICFLTAIA
jgi:hypothetical protein